MHYLNILSPKLWRPATRLAGDTAKPHSTLTPAVHSDTFRSRLSCPRRSGTGHHTNATLAIFRTTVTYPHVAHFAPPERLSASLHSGSCCPGECSSSVPPSLLPTVSKCSLHPGKQHLLYLPQIHSNYSRHKSRSYELLMYLIGSAHPSLTDVTRYYFLHPSKQLRPLLTLLRLQAANGLGHSWRLIVGCRSRKD